MNLCKLLSTDGFLTGWVSLREGATVIGVRTMVQCWIHINYMKLLAAVLALKYLVCVSPSGYDFVTAWKMHQILVASRWLAKSWEVEITRLWHLALHRERPSKSGKVLHSRPELSLERSNLLAPGVPRNVVVTIESGIIYQKPLGLQILQQQGSSFGQLCIQPEAGWPRGVSVSDISATRWSSPHFCSIL